MIELRYVYDCESMRKVLQFREKISDNIFTNWKTVPTVMGTVDGNEAIANSDQARVVE